MPKRKKKQISRALKKKKPNLMPLRATKRGKPGSLRIGRDDSFHDGACKERSCAVRVARRGEAIQPKIQGKKHIRQMFRAKVGR